jgi:hypothetical protein
MNKYLANLHQGAIPSTHKFANELRHRSTEAEQILWSLLRKALQIGRFFAPGFGLTPQYFISEKVCGNPSPFKRMF